jgi:Phytanoyl-CoA dioxygenase (PhyH)
MIEIFNSAGWHLGSSVLEREVVIEAREFLESSKVRLHQLFAEWLGTDSSDALDYAAHQRQLPVYEARGLPSDLRHFLVGEFDLETRLDGRITDVLSTSGCRDFICDFLGSKHYYIHYPPMIRFKVAGAPSNLVPVHQDAAYNRHLASFITVWVPLIDINDECGGIIVYEGSQRSNLFEHQASGAWSNRAQVDPSNFPARHITMKMGDALLFPPTLLHESAPHLSSQTRFSIDFRVFREGADTSKSYYDPFTKTIRRLH